MCPNNDIHSLYFDNELPEVHKLKYEEHIQNCSSCAAKQEKYHFISTNLDTDFKHYDTGEGYERLENRMRFSNNVVEKKSIKTIVFKCVPLMAAAAVLSVFLPVVSNQLKNDSAQTIDFPLNMQSYAFGASVENQINNFMKRGVTSDAILPVSYTNTSLSQSNFMEFNVFEPEVHENTIPIEILIYISPSRLSDKLGNFANSTPLFLLQE